MSLKEQNGRVVKFWDQVFWREIPEVATYELYDFE